MSNTDIVQIISLPLEVSGFVLTILEVFLKGTNSKLELKFRKFIQWTDSIWKKYNNKLALTYSVFLLLTFIGITFFNDTRIGFLSSLLFIANIMLLFVFDFLRKLFPDRHLLALALTLSLMGILGEIYQVTHIDF